MATSVAGIPAIAESLKQDIERLNFLRWRLLKLQEQGKYEGENPVRPPLDLKALLGVDDSGEVTFCPSPTTHTETHEHRKQLPCGCTLTPNNEVVQPCRALRSMSVMHETYVKNGGHGAERMLDMMEKHISNQLR